MKIKGPIEGRFKVIRRLRDRTVLKRLLLSLVGLGIAAILFFGVLAYGAHLKKIGQTRYYKPALLQIASLDFSFMKKYLRGQFTNLDKMKVDIKFKHLLRLDYLRNQALEKGYISDDLKSEEFPATLMYRGKKHDIKVSLTGMMPMHISDPLKWSFQIKVQGDDTVDGIKRFNLLLPHTRGYLTDWLGMELMKERGLMGLRLDFVNVSINGKPLGVFYLEERFDKLLVENNHLREGIIFRLENDLVAYREDKLQQDPNTKQQLLKLKQMWQEVMSGDLDPGKFFDLRKMATLFAVTDLMNNKHALYRTNLRFYLNPVTGLVEPIAREWGSLSRNKPGDLALFLEKPRIGTQHEEIASDSVINLIVSDLEFKKYYLREAEIISNPDFLDNALSRNGEKLNTLVRKVYRDWPFYQLPTHTLYQNQLYFKTVLAADLDQLTAYFTRKEENRFILFLQNLQDLPLEVLSVGWRDSIFFYPEESTILTSMEDRSGEPRYFKVPADISLHDSLIPELEVHYSILGTEQGRRKTLVFPWAYEDRYEFSANPVAKEPNVGDFDFIKQNPEKGEICIPAGNWVITKDLIVPPEMEFVLEAGAKIDLKNRSRIICFSPIFCNGTEQNPVQIYSSDTTGEGLLVVGAQLLSKLTYTYFDHLSRPIEDGWQLTGAITFYESPVNIINCKFSNNQVGDDYLNIIRSHFLIDQTHFNNVMADAFDADFCTGTVSNSSFVNIGNDGIDVSGTVLEVNEIYMNGVGDKGLSAGEDSKLVANVVEIRNAEIGVTSKDRSQLEVFDLKLLNSKIGVALFQKKSEFGPAYASIQKVNLSKSDIPFLVEESSTLIIEGERYFSDRHNVKEILYGVEYGKSSK